MKLVIPVLALLLLCGCTGDPRTPPQHEYPITPVPFTEVRITDNFWSSRIRTNHEVTIPIAIRKSEETGRVDNFRIAGGLMEGEFCSPYPFDDSDIYKIIEGAAYSLQMLPDPQLESTVDSLIRLIGLAQEEDGYLFTNRTIMGENGHPWIGKTRWEKVDDLSHELYNLGHFYEAAVAWHQATGQREILDMAIRSADLVDKTFGPGKLENWPGHQEIEIGLVKLFRETGEERYLNLARFFLDVRSKGIGKKKTYNQSHLPVVEQNEAVGHSVRAAYMWTGMADVAALTGDQSYVNAITRIWEDVVYRKLYITGGIGAEGGHEGFGGAYELPNEKAYCETCAAIANVFFNQRMFLMTGEARYIDVLERSLYNNVLSGVGLSGDLFFYPNPLASSGQHRRSEWFGCACCPSNISRFIPAMPNYLYAQQGDKIYINLFVASRTSFDIKGNTMEVEQETGMPHTGGVTIRISPEKPVRATFNIRIPGWASGHPVPGNLYHFADTIAPEITIRVNGKPAPYKTEKGYVVISGKWKKGNRIDFELPMKVNRILANPAILDNQDRMALQRGPLVYCVEWPDVPGSTVSNLVVSPDALIETRFEPEMLRGITTLQFEASDNSKVGNGDPGNHLVTVKAIPYYAWAHRGPGQMAVWLSTAGKAPTPSGLQAVVAGR